MSLDNLYFALFLLSVLNSVNKKVLNLQAKGLVPDAFSVHVNVGRQ